MASTVGTQDAGYVSGGTGPNRRGRDRDGGRDADCADRARHGDAACDRDSQIADLRIFERGRVRGRANRQERRPARADRCPTLRGVAGAIPGAAQERRGAPEECPARPGPLSEADGAGRDLPADRRHPSRDRAAIRRHGGVRSGAGRPAEAQHRVLPHRLADRRPGRPAQGRRRQLCASLRHRRHRGRHATASDLREVQLAGGPNRPGDEAAHCRRHLDRHGLRQERHDRDRNRQAADRRQPDRHDDRHRQVTGHLRQRGQCAVSQPVRQHQAGGRHPKGRLGGPGGGDPLRNTRRLCLSRDRRRHGCGAAGAGRCVRRYADRGDVGAGTGRARRHRRGRSAARRREGQRVRGCPDPSRGELGTPGTRTSRA